MPLWDTIPVGVAQLDSASDSDSEGRGFESHRLHFFTAADVAVLFFIGKNMALESQCLVLLAESSFMDRTRGKSMWILPVHY